MKSNINHTLFDNWNEISAYIFGFWLADGHIRVYRFKNSNKYQKRFHITNTDKQLIYEIGKIMGKLPTLCKKYEQHYKQVYGIEIISNKLFDFCYDMVGTHYKSSTEIPIPKIPKKLFHHFVRGFFDGDGSIHIKHYKTRHGKLVSALQTSFTSGIETGDFLENFKQKLREFIPVGNKKISTGLSKKLIFNQYDSMLLCEWMYKDATIYMKRKKKIWDESDKERLKKSTKFFSNKV